MADSSQNDVNQHSVRFSSVNQEISPLTQDNSLEMTRTKTSADEPPERLTDEQRKDIRELSMSLQKSRMQSARLNQFVMEPVSLPTSRVPSGSSSTQVTPAPTGLTPRTSSTPHSPLTPADSGNNEKEYSSSKASPAAMLVTPQVSPQPGSREVKPSAAAEAREAFKPKQTPELHGAIPVHPKQPLAQIILPKGDSLPPSQDQSPVVTPAPESGAQSPFPRPLTPNLGDPNDPYAKSRRIPQNRNLEGVDNRFKFQERPRSLFASGGTSPRVSIDGTRPEDKRASFFAAKKDPVETTQKKEKEHHHTMSDLKRYFKIGGSKKDKHDKTKKTSEAPKPSRKGTATPPSRTGSMGAMPFADDHGLEARYGKFEKMLGSGAGGSVRLMKRRDGVTFAVKQFREKHTWETEKAYNKKITAEFCIVSTLHHGNIIEAMDIVNENGRWYEVMEYAPFDLFNIVMTGEMSREEVACSTMQILNGVAYLHSMGLAHRDLKLDNVVVNEHGIMKIIDFGSAHVFQYPFEEKNVPADGVVGSDPYLAPEVFTQKQYDAQKVDIWSLAIIFCCMTLRRFPWKCPKSTDNSFRLFVTQPTEDELNSSLYPGRPREQTKSEPASRHPSDSTSTSHHHHHHRADVNKSEPASHSQPADNTQPDTQSSVANDNVSTSTATIASTPSQQQPTVLKGPWRLLRLLPRETRHIVSRMLEIDPLSRATLEEVTSDAWITRTVFCRQEVGGRVIYADGHRHHLATGDENSEVKIAKRPPYDGGDEA